MAIFNAHGLPIHDDGTGTERVLGTLKAPPGLVLMATAFLALIPESDWRAFDYRAQNPPIKVKNQGQRGACVGHATATALEWARWLAGLMHVDLSAWFLYAILCNGIDRGASISEALDLATKTGTCPEPEVPYSTIAPSRLSAEAHRDAAKYRIELGGATPTFAQMMSETQSGRPGNFSIGVGAGFNSLDADGVVRSNGSLNHSICYGLGAKKTRSGKWAILCQNSWDTTWGDGGYFWITQDNIYRGNDSWSIVAPIDTPGDVLNPPVALA